jgi:hypothetical protein
MSSLFKTESSLREEEIEKSRILGGNLETTHLVKGLDYELLKKVRSGAFNDIEIDDNNIRPNNINTINSTTTTTTTTTTTNNNKYNNNYNNNYKEKEKEKEKPILSTLSRNLLRVLDSQNDQQQNDDLKQPINCYTTFY